MALVSPRASTFTQRFRVPPVDHPDEVEHRRMLAESVQLLFNGKILATGNVTLTANSATTTLTDRRIGPSSILLFMPTSANSKAEGDPWPSARGKGTATLNHANNAQADRTYGYAILG